MKKITIEDTLLNYDCRANLDLENYLFTLIDTSSLEDNQYGDIENINNIDRFNKINLFIKSLSSNQLKSNCILKMTKIFLDTSILDCHLIVEKLYTELDKMEQLIKTLKSLKIDLNNVDLKNILLFPEHQMISISCDGIIKNYLPNIIEEINIFSLFKDKKATSNIEQLKKRNELIRRYNNYVELITSIANDIYKMQLCNMLINNNKNIYDFSFNLSFCDPFHKLETQFVITKEEKSKLLKLNLK